MALNPNSKWPTQTVAPSSDYPYGSAQDITTPGDGTGTPFVADLVDDWFGFQQECLQRAGITPSGNPDHAGDSDVFDGLRRSCGYPGLIVPSMIYADPASLGLRLLYLDGSGILAASYPDLVTACYIGDANNADTDADAFYKSSDAAGTTRTTAGPYIILPDMRGKFIRGYDLSAVVDPDGLSRSYKGTNQAALTEDHYHRIHKNLSAPSANDYSWRDAADPGVGAAVTILVAGDANPIYAGDDSTDAALGAETRPVNVNAGWYIWY